MSAVSLLPLAQGWAAGALWPPPALNLQGVWWNEHPLPALAPDSGEPVPFTQKGLERYQASHRAALAQAAQSPGRNEVSRCLPYGPTRILQQPFPVQIVQKGDLFVLLYEHNHVYEIAYLNQKPDPDRDPAFMGNTVGTWVADGIELTTTRFKPGTLLDDSGLPHSDQLVLSRRLHESPSTGRLQITMTISDPVMFTKPWQVSQVLTRRAGTGIEEYACGQGPTLETRYSRASPAP